MRPRNLITISLRQDQIDAIMWKYPGRSAPQAVKELINDQLPFIISAQANILKKMESQLLDWIKTSCRNTDTMNGNIPDIYTWLKDHDEEFRKAVKEYEEKEI